MIDARRVVVATGPFQRPIIPPIAPLEARIAQIHSAGYRNPGQLPDSGVLVVGAGSSGVQIADELRRAGRRVYLTVGPHDRPPRHYRNRAFCWWLGVLGESVRISLSSVKNRGIFAKYLSILVSRTWPARRRLAAFKFSPADLVSLFAKEGGSPVPILRSIA